MTFAAFLLLASPSVAQDLELPILSPRATVSQQVGTVTVSVDYGSPGKRDRAIFGELLPYGQLWRTGANRTTSLTVSGDVTIGGKEVPEGSYSVFTMPAEDNWTFILNTDVTASEGRYDANKDQARFMVKPAAGPDRERLTFLFTDTHSDSSVLQLEWAGVQVSVPIEVDSKGRGDRDIELFVSRAARGLTDAARFKGENGDVDAGLGLIDKALGVESTWYVMWAKAELLHMGERHKDAHKVAKEVMRLGEASDNFFWKDRVEKALAEWPKK